MIAVEDFGAALLSPEGVQDPYAIYGRLREVGPVHWDETLQAWLVTGYRQVRDVYRSHARFSSVGKRLHNVYALPLEVRHRVPLVELVEGTPVLGTADPPVHTLHRGSVARPLQPRRLEEKRTWVENLCMRLADSIADQREPELIQNYSLPFSYESILGLFGSPLELIPLYQEATTARDAFWSFRQADERAALRYEASLVALKGAIESLYPKVRDNADSATIIGSLLQPLPSAPKLDELEVFAILRMFFTAAQENLIYTIATAVYQLLRHPDQLKLVRDNRNLSVAAFEEAVRFDTQSQANPRIVSEDCDYYGQVMRKGQRVLNFKGAANRDPEVWKDPDEFDITRDQNEPEGGSVAFGQGIHFCVGAGVARLAAPIAISTLFDRFPNIRLLEGWTPTWEDEPMKRKLTALPLRLE